MHIPSFLRPVPIYTRILRQIGSVLSIDDKARPVLGGTFFLFFAESIFATVFNLYLHHALGMSYSAITGLFAFTVLMGALVSFPIGYICDHVGRKMVLYAGFYFWLAGLLGLAIFQSFFVMMFFGAIHGIGMAAVWTAYSPLLVDLTPKEQHVKAFTANFLVMFGASVAGYILGGLLPIANSFLFPHIGSAYRLTMFEACFLLLPAYRYFTRLPVEHVSRAKFKILHAGKIEKRRRLIATIELLLPYVLTGMAVGLTLPFVNIFLRSELGVKDHYIGFSLAAVSLAQALLILSIPYISAHIGRIALAALALLIASPLLAAVGFVSNPILLVVALVVAAAVAQMSIPLQLSFAMRQFPTVMRGVVSAELSAVWYLSNGVGALLSLGFSGNELELLAKNYVPAAVLSLLGGTLYWIFWRSRNVSATKANAAEIMALSHGPSSRYCPVDADDGDGEAKAATVPDEQTVSSREINPIETMEQEDAD